MDIVNIAGYKFVHIPELKNWRAPLRARCDALELKGTILLAPEGINLFLAGPEDRIDAIMLFLRDATLFRGAFSDLQVKRSLSAKQPFRRMLVRLKKEMITMRHPVIVPEAGRAPAITPKELCHWLDLGVDDDGRELVLLDTRNAFEVALGSFDGARRLDIARFGDFPQAFEAALADGSLDIEGKRVVTFCTGGIRCEKAALYIDQHASCHVTQLDGGILKYFEDVGGAHWHGECFVFDDRVALDPDLRETSTTQCYACRGVVSVLEQEDERYQKGESCPRCAVSKGAALSVA